MRGSKRSALFWRFEKPLRVKEGPLLLPRLEREMYAEFNQGFRDVYREVLRATVSRDREMLRDALQQRLYSRVHSDLARIEAKKQKLELANEDSIVSLVLRNAKLHVNITADRKIPPSQPVIALYEVSDSEDEDESDFEPRLHMEDGLFYQPDDVKNEFSAVLTVDCVYLSCLKLLLRSESGEVLRGKNNSENEVHIFRFETEFYCKDFDSLSGYYFSGEGTCPIDTYNWTLCDIDRCLRGNPLVPYLFKFPNTEVD